MVDNDALDISPLWQSTVKTTQPVKEWSSPENAKCWGISGNDLILNIRDRPPKKYTLKGTISVVGHREGSRLHYLFSLRDGKLLYVNAVTNEVVSLSHSVFNSPQEFATTLKWSSAVYALLEDSGMLKDLAVEGDT